MTETPPSSAALPFPTKSCPTPPVPCHPRGRLLDPVAPSRRPPPDDVGFEGFGPPGPPVPRFSSQIGPKKLPISTTFVNLRQGAGGSDAGAKPTGSTSPICSVTDMLSVLSPLPIFRRKNPYRAAASHGYQTP